MFIRKFDYDTSFHLELQKSILLFPIGPVWFIKLGDRMSNKFPFLRELGIMSIFVEN